MLFIIFILFHPDIEKEDKLFILQLYPPPPPPPPPTHQKKKKTFPSPTLPPPPLPHGP